MAPCSSMCTAFSLAIAFGYTVPAQSAQIGEWLPPTGGVVSYWITVLRWLRSDSALNVTPWMSAAHCSSFRYEVELVPIIFEQPALADAEVLWLATT